MEAFTGKLSQYLGEIGTLIHGTVVIVLVVLALSLMNRILHRHADSAKGNTFRNQVIMFVASFIGLLMIILGLPIDPSTRGQLLQLLGIILSVGIALSSSTFISNGMAGIMLKTVRNFRTGDFIKADHVFGRVTERGLFHTEIQTPDRDLTTLPNLFLATSAVTVVRQSGTIIGATVSLGYDVPHTRIEELLLKAAKKIELQDPFVQVLELGDYSVVYRVAGLLTETKQLITYRSRLRASMLDTLHENQVEIVSPQFNNARVLDPDLDFIPPATTTSQAPAADAAPVEVVFDKAEEAEGLNVRRQELNELDEQIKELKKQAKEASGDEKDQLERKIEALERKIETRQSTLAEAEKRVAEDSD